MTIDEFIEKLEDIYLEDAIKEITAKERITFYLSAKEFQRSKLIRGNYIPEDDSDEKEVKITIIKKK